MAIRGAFSILPARFLNRGLVSCIAIMVARFLATLLPAIELLSVCSISVVCNRLPIAPAKECLNLSMRALFPGAVTMPMNDWTMALHLPF